MQLSGIVVLCIDNDLAILDGMETLLGGWGCRVLKSPDLASAIATVAESKVTPDGLLVDYHLDQGNGIEAIAELRRRFGADLTADSHHRRPQPACPRGSARAWRAGAQQAGQAGRAARAADAMAGAAGGGGGINPALIFNLAVEQITNVELAGSVAGCGHWPSSIFAAAITAWVRLSTPSFCRIAETCALMVASDTLSS